eukprot:COSAG02_NODE_8590_length_2512_cov_1.718193_1_plen_581_part_00
MAGNWVTPPIPDGLQLAPADSQAAMHASCISVNTVARIRHLNQAGCAGSAVLSSSAAVLTRVVLLLATGCCCWCSVSASVTRGEASTMSSGLQAVLERRSDPPEMSAAARRRKHATYNHSAQWPEFNQGSGARAIMPVQGSPVLGAWFAYTNNMSRARNGVDPAKYWAQYDVLVGGDPATDAAIFNAVRRAGTVVANYVDLGYETNIRSGAECWRDDLIHAQRASIDRIAPFVDGVFFDDVDMYTGEMACGEKITDLSQPCVMTPGGTAKNCTAACGASNGTCFASCARCVAANPIEQKRWCALIAPSKNGTGDHPYGHGWFGIRVLNGTERAARTRAAVEYAHQQGLFVMTNGGAYFEYDEILSELDWLVIENAFGAVSTPQDLFVDIPGAIAQANAVRARYALHGKPAFKLVALTYINQKAMEVARRLSDAYEIKGVPVPPENQSAPLMGLYDSFFHGAGPAVVPFTAVDKHGEFVCGAAAEVLYKSGPDCYSSGEPSANWSSCWITAPLVNASDASSANQSYCNMWLTHWPSKSCYSSGRARHGVCDTLQPWFANSGEISSTCPLDYCASGERIGCK